MAEGAADLIEAIALLRLEPGDILVLRTDARLRSEEVARIREHLSAILPDGVRSMIVDGGMSLEVIKHEPVARDESHYADRPDPDPYL